MDWVTAIQRSIDFTELHLLDDIDLASVAKQACSSVFHFQRMFSAICEYTIGDYIRMRRLSLAAEELHKCGGRIIDVALKYGYDSPESFTRAFSRFHGITPSEARNGGSTKLFSRLHVKIVLSGGNLMEYRIEKRPAFTVIAKKKHVNKPQGDTATADISAFWGECNSDGTMDCISKYANFDNLHGILGICFSNEMADNGFPYGIGAEYNGVPVTEDGLSIVEIPAYTYAVFTVRGKMPEAFVKTYKKICTEFFPQSSTYEYGSGIELEVYPSSDVNSDDYYCEIWIAVNPKKTNN